MRDEQADEKHAPAGAEPPPDPHPRRIATVENARTAPLTQEIPVSPDVTIGQFDNGLRYYIRQNHEPENRAQLRLVVRAGSIVEDDDQSQRTGIRAMATVLQPELREV
jgi:zinc protease